jgi:hypothetical protein
MSHFSFFTVTNNNLFYIHLLVCKSIRCLAQLQSELKISEANAGAKPTNLSESEFPEF